MNTFTFVLLSVAPLLALAIPLPVKNTAGNSISTYSYKNLIILSLKNVFILVQLMRSGDKNLNFEEISGQFQGDIILTNEQERIWSGIERTGLINGTYRWPENTIPYTLSSVFNEAQLAHIHRGLREIEEATCLKFVVRTTEANFVNVTVSDYFLSHFCRNFVGAPKQVIFGCTITF